MMVHGMHPTNTYSIGCYFLVFEHYNFKIYWLYIKYHIAHRHIDTGLDRLQPIAANFARLQVFDHAADFITAAHMTNTLPAAVIEAHTRLLGGK